tara:strand:+ start:160 stop:363 length:204 start_codon:yes stop_codon:yes gene_type:complete
MHLLIASLNFTHQTDFRDIASSFLAERSLILGWILGNWQDFTSWLSQPYMSSSKIVGKMIFVYIEEI